MIHQPEVKHVVRKTQVKLRPKDYPMEFSNIKQTRNLLINETHELANQNSFSLDPNKVIVISVDI